MKGSETKLIKYMSGSDKRFVIPVYQRNYDWKIENCNQLYNDLIKLIHNDRNSHFFGSIVSVYNPDGANEEFLVIDGQQRLTTLSLLFLAMYNLMTEKVVIPEKESLREKIFEEYLIDKWKTDDTRIKLRPVKNDLNAYRKLFDDKSDYITDSNITINYNYFYERIQRQEITIDELFVAISRLEIINITLNNEDNPQLIFESLNSTGLALSEGDKIRNFILMGQPTAKQEEYYNKYWNKIEERTEYDVTLFIRDYLSIKRSLTPSMSKIYFSFKDYVESGKFNVEELLIDLLKYANLYQILLKDNTEDRKLNGSIYRFNKLEITVTRPFFMEVLRLKEENILDLKDVVEIFSIIESYYFRRLICDLSTNMLNKLFLTLHKDVIKFDGTTDNYVEKLKYILISKKDRARFPEDGEFKKEISTKSIYRSKNILYVLERFENHGTFETKNVWEHIECGDYTIEHIMPQRLTPAWVSSLGEDYQIIHETWLHRLANLTLTAYNQKYSNSIFDEKKNMQNGFLQSGIRMNQLIAQKNKWDIEELEDRNNYLKKIAVKIWPRPKSTFKPAVKLFDICTLDEEIDLTGSKIVKFSYKNIEQPVKNWTEMYQSVLKMLHSEDKSILIKLAANSDFNTELSLHVSNKNEDFTKCSEIDDGIYVWTNTSTQYKINTLKKFFKRYNADPSELLFFLKTEI